MAPPEEVEADADTAAEHEHDELALPVVLAELDLAVLAKEHDEQEGTPQCLAGNVRL
jgi:hypothetical protein